MSAITEADAADIRAVFARYVTAWNGRDLEGIAACFTEPATLVLPAATYALADRAALVSLLGGIFAALQKDGFGRTHMDEVTITSCGDGLAIVDAQNVTRLRTDGSVMDVIDGHYVLRRGDRWAIAVAVACTKGWAAA